MTEANPTAGNRAIEIYDTTLRDGTQGEQVAFTVSEKLRVLDILDRLGIQFIEGGWPGANPRDSEFFRQARKAALQKARLCAFGSTAHPAAKPEQDANLRALLAAETEWVTIFGKSWTLHVESALGITRDENLRLIEASVRFLHQSGRRVIFDAEHFFDGYRADAEYGLQVLRAAESGGATRLVLCDTNGGSMPDWLGGVVSQVRSTLPGIELGIHTHDDCGLGAANALAAVRAGATQVQGTFNGWGERCGNASLCTLLPVLELKLGYPTIGAEALRELTSAARQIAELAGLALHPRLPFVGQTAFAHKGGIHVSAVRKLPASYEHLPPEAVGNVRRILVSDLAGRSNIQEKARELGWKNGLSAEAAARVTQTIKDWENQGYELEGADGTLALLIEEAIGGAALPFQPLGFEVTSTLGQEKPLSRAQVRVAVKGREYRGEGADTGPVAALDAALRQALIGHYPQLAEVELTDYKVRILEGSRGTRAQVRVRVESSIGTQSWITVGVSENILEASWKALIASFACHLRPAARGTKNSPRQN